MCGAASRSSPTLRYGSRAIACSVEDYLSWEFVGIIGLREAVGAGEIA
jgi:hypothetical protein